MIILYIVEEKIWDVIVYKLVVQKNAKVRLKTALKLMGKKIIMPKRGEYVQFKNYEREV